jgi:hypothetical protein
MSDTGFDFLSVLPIILLVFTGVVLVMAFRFQSNYLKNLARQAEALERIATSLEKRP